MTEATHLAVDYSGVTESAGDSVSREALSMFYTRYRFAAEFCAGKEVLEVACGEGTGLGYLARTARRVIGGDFTESLIRRARSHYNGRIPLLRLDAHRLPFQAQSFDVLVLYEAIYYLAEAERFLGECRRLLRKNGTLIICTANKEWPDFNPSSFSTRYFSMFDMCELLKNHGFAVDAYGAFPAVKKSVRDSVVSWIKRSAVALKMIPKTMKRKALLKRVFLGPLYQVPAEIDDGMAPYCRPTAVMPSPGCSTYKVVFAVARLL